MNNHEAALASNALQAATAFYGTALANKVRECEELTQELKALPVLANEHRALQGKYQALYARAHAVRVALREVTGLSDAEVNARDAMLRLLDGDDA